MKRDTIKNTNTDGKIIPSIFISPAGPAPLKETGILQPVGDFLSKRQIYEKAWYLRNKDRLKKIHEEYYQNNKKGFYERSKKWRSTNKEKVSKQAKLRYLKNPDKFLKRHKEWYMRNQKQEQKRKRKYYYQYQEKHKIYARKQRKEYLKSWEGYIPLETKCQLCERKIYFNKSDVKNAINFDHKRSTTFIKVNPTGWLANHPKTSNNQKIWESCNFGMLCYKCNRLLPTYGRKKFLQNAIKYVFGKNLLTKKEVTNGESRES